jgi:hypothetical protein
MKHWPYTHHFTSQHGKDRFIYRRERRHITLKGKPGTAEFQQSYDEAAALFEKPKGLVISSGVGQGRSDKPRPNTLRWLAVECFQSSVFRELGALTQDERRRILEHILLEATAPGSKFLFGDYLIKDLNAEHVRVLMENKKDFPNAANHRRKALSFLFGWAVDKQLMKRNWALDVRKVKIKSGGHHSWTEEEREQYKVRHPIGTMPRLAFDMFFFLGQRIGDVWRFGSPYLQNGRLCFTQEKNREHEKPMYLELDIVPELRASLDATKTGDLRWLEQIPITRTRIRRR